MKRAIEDSWTAVHSAVNRNAYTGESAWAFVGLVALFVVGYIVIGYLALPMRFESAITALAAWVLGSKQSRTFRPNEK